MVNGRIRLTSLYSTELKQIMCVVNEPGVVVFFCVVLCICYAKCMLSHSFELSICKIDLIVKIVQQIVMYILRSGLILL